MWFQFFHFFVTFWPTGLAQGPNCPILGTKPQISQRQDFLRCATHFIACALRFWWKKSLVQKNLSFYSNCTQIAEICGILPIKAPIGWKKLLSIFFSRYSYISTSTNAFWGRDSFLKNSSVVWAYLTRTLWNFLIFARLNYQNCGF